MIEGTNGQDEVIENPKKVSVGKVLLGITLLFGLSYAAFPTLSQWYSAVPTIATNSVQIDTVIRGDLIRDVVVSGKAVAANAPQLYSTEIGKITMLAKPGEAVEVCDASGILLIQGVLNEDGMLFGDWPVIDSSPRSYLALNGGKLILHRG